MQINIDKCSKTPRVGAGTVYFTSIRPQEQGAWRIGKFLVHFSSSFHLSTNTRSVRYKVIADDGQVIRLEDQAIRPEQKGAK